VLTGGVNPSPPTPGAGQPTQGGWHGVDWACEFAGTAILLIGGLSAICLDFGAHSPVAAHLASASARRLLTGLLFAGTGSLVAVSPLGRRSGAHLNPAVTFAYWTQRRVHPHDLAGYVLAQLLGGLAGAAAVLALWGGTARALALGATSPRAGVGNAQAVGIEALMTATLIFTFFMFTSDTRTARWTPLANWVLVALLVWVGAPYTGTSLNPARSLGPAVLAPLLHPLWIYLVGPLSGALVAAGAFGLLRDRHTLTAKLFHDPRYRSPFASALPVARR
jgi:aquaporin Z